MVTPTSSASENFGFAYALTGSAVGTGFTIENESSNPKSAVVPAAANVTVEDPDGDKIKAGHQLYVTSEGLNIDPVFGVSNDYVFVGQGTVADNGKTLSGIIVESTTSGRYYFLTDKEYKGALGNGNGDVTITHMSDTICFVAGTMIQTPAGEVAIETLKRGDFVLNNEGRSVPVDWLGVQTVSLRFADKMRVLPIRVRAGALADNVPARDLLVSPDHALLVEGALIQAGALVNGISIVRETNMPTTFTYFHVEVEDHSLIMAENTPAETFVDNVDRLGFDNWAEHEALYPNGKHVNELPYPRAKSHRQVPVSIRVMLGARAQAIHASERSAVA
jgi:hypothetical protein